MKPLKDQSPEEFEMLIKTHRPRIHAFLLSLTGSSSAADDLCQETCLVLWNKWETFDPSQDFRAWAFRIAFLQTQNFRRRVARQAGREMPGDDLFEHIAAAATFTQEAGEKEEARQNALLACLKKLGESQRDLLLSRYQDGTSLESLSRSASLSRNAMAQKLFRLKKKLLRCVEKRLLPSQT